MYKILTLNNISVQGLQRLPRENYEVASEVSQPDAVLLRSFKMHDMQIPESVAAIGRAGAGVNNIPVDKMTLRGVPVFNAPGANANAVKELVLAGLLIASRNIAPAMQFAAGLSGTDSEISTAVESGKEKLRWRRVAHQDTRCDRPRRNRTASCQRGFVFRHESCRV